MVLEIKKYLLNPQSAISRWIDSFMLILSGLSSVLTYYFIEYDVCLNAECDKLSITGFWANNSYIYLIFGVSLLSIGVFVAKEKRIARIYSLSILLTCLVGATSNSLIFFAILRELKSIT